MDTEGLGGRSEKLERCEDRFGVEYVLDPSRDKGPHGFSSALVYLKAGAKVARSGWNGKGMWIAMQVPGANSKMTHPYLYIEYPEGHPAYPNGSRVPWLASQTDLLACDWEVVP